MTTFRTLKQKFALIWPHLDERARRMMAANEARQLGYGGVSSVSRACGLSRVTLTKGMRELGAPALEEGRIRHPGAGRPALLQLDPDLPRRLEGLGEPLTRGDPQSPLRSTSKSTRSLAAELNAQRHPASHEKVAQLLREMGYSLQGNRKTEEEDDHPDRDAQFQRINEQVRRALARARPVISVDTKKKELVGNYENKGRAQSQVGAESQRSRFSRPFGASRFSVRHLLARNTGIVNVGTDYDTGAFAVASIRGWWRIEGRRLYPSTRKLVITADGGGSNGYRLHQWKLELQKFADSAGVSIMVYHFPPGTSTWNKVEHRLFSFISSNRRGEPLRDYETVVRLIAGTTTAKGLSVTCVSDVTSSPAAFVLRGIDVDASALPTGTSLPAVGDIVRGVGTVAHDGESVTASSVMVLHVARSAIYRFGGDVGNVAAGTTTNIFVLTLLGQNVVVTSNTQLADRSMKLRDNQDPESNPFNINTFQTYLAASASKHLIVTAEADGSGNLTALCVTIVPPSTTSVISGMVDASPLPFIDIRISNTTIGTKKKGGLTVGCSRVEGSVSRRCGRSLQTKHPSIRSDYRDGRWLSFS